MELVKRICNELVWVGTSWRPLERGLIGWLKALCLGHGKHTSQVFPEDPSGSGRNVYSHLEMPEVHGSWIWFPSYRRDVERVLSALVEAGWPNEKEGWCAWQVVPHLFSGAASTVEEALRLIQAEKEAFLREMDRHEREAFLQEGADLREARYWDALTQILWFG